MMSVNMLCGKRTHTPRSRSKLGVELTGRSMIEDDRNSRFSEVVLPHLPDALTTALWLPGNRTDAEDVVQEACLRAFRLIANFTSGNARDRVPHANLHPQVIAPSR